MIGDPMLSAVGPYSFTGSGYNAMNDISMMPIMQQYNQAVSQLDNAADMRLNSGVTIPQTTVQAPTFDSEKMWEQMEVNQNRMMEANQRNQERWMNQSLQQNQMWRQNSAMINSPLYKISEAADALRDKVVQNEQDQVQEALAALKNAIKEANYPNQDVDDAILTAEAKNYYRTRFGQRIEDDLRNYGTSSFWNGFIRKATCGLFGDKYTPEDNIAQINHQSVSETSKKWNKTGKIAAGATTTAVGAGIGFLIGGPVGAIIGGHIGLAYGIFS